MHCLPPTSTLFPYTTLFRSQSQGRGDDLNGEALGSGEGCAQEGVPLDEGLQAPLQRRPVQPPRHAEDGRSIADPTAGIELIERSEEHTSELQSLTNLVCRLL